MFAVPRGSYHTIKPFCVKLFESYGETSSDVFISKKSIVIRNGKTENLTKLDVHDVHAFFISNAFFKSASVLLNFFMN